LAIGILSPVMGQDVADVAPAKPAAKQYRYWNTRWSFDDVDIGKLVDRLASIGLEVPIRVRGDVSVELSVGVPLNGLREPKAYRFDGSLASRHLYLDNLHLSDFQSDLAYDDGVVTLSRLDSHWESAPTTGTKSSDSPSSPTVPATPRPNTSTAPRTGSIRGNATVQLVPQGSLDAKLQLQDLATGPLVELLEQAGVFPQPIAIGGLVTGKADLKCDVQQLDRPETWQLSGELRSPSLRINELPEIKFDAPTIRISDSFLTLDKVSMSYVQNPDVKLNARLAYQLVSPNRFEIELDANDLPTEQIVAMVGDATALIGDSTESSNSSAAMPIQTRKASSVTGKVDINLRGRGEFQSETWSAVGRIASPGLQVAGVDLGLLEHELRTDQTTFSLVPLELDPQSEPSTLQQRGLRIGSIQADYQFSESTIDLTNLDATLFGGEVRGSASIARSNDEGQRHTIDAQWNGLASEFPAPLPGGPRTVFVSTSGDVKWQVPADRLDQPLAHRGSANVRIAELKVADIDIGSIDAKLAANGETIDASGQGTLLGGKFEFATVAGIDQRTTWFDVLDHAWRTELTIESAKIGSLGRVLMMDNFARVHGQFSATVSIDHRQLPGEHDQPLLPPPRLIAHREPSRQPGRRFDSREPQGRTRWSGTVSLRNVMVQGRPVTPRLVAELRGDESMIVLDRVTGRYAEGQLSGTGVWSLDGVQTQMNVRASSVNIPLALIPVWPDAHRWVQGHASANATISGRESLSARGSVQWQGGKVFDLSVDSGHGAVDARWNIATSRWQADSRNLRIRAGQGEIETVIHLASGQGGRGFNLSSRSKARRVDFAKLLGYNSDSFAIANSRASGDFSLGGRSIRSVNDLVGRFDAQLDGTEARAVPGLSDTQNYLGAISLASIRFDEGRMVGTVRRGTVSLNEFSLIDQRLRVFADGTVGLADGRMQVEAVLNTGDFRRQNFLLRQFANVASGGASIPLDVIIEINELLSNRTLIVDINGPITDPRVRLKTVDTLRENAVDFFIRQAGRAVAASVIGASNQ
tara:strand:+ start:83325 stop:86438 length:3114 start_codon:yes stop_codon:yes gene_type:complete